jgi:hypothetical protein
MTDRLDVAGRLAEGRPAVEHTQTYVHACHQLGYQQPDLTAHASQVWDWYDTEAGLDLRVLDDDCAELRAAVNAIDEALWVQRAQLAELASAWRGLGADSATRFLQRHSDAAAQVAARVRAAAQSCAALRDEVWQSVDGKVGSTVAIDERRLGERSVWLAAAHAVTTGTGDRSAAEDLVRQQVNPYVDNDIRIDWLAAMRATTASVTESYDAAIHALSYAPEACFEVPGDLGPTWQPAAEEPVHPGPTAPPASDMPLPAYPVPTVPAAAPVPVPPTDQAAQPLSTDGLDESSLLPPDMAAPLGSADGLSTGAGGLGGIAGSIGGVVGQIVDSLGGLLGSLTGGSGDNSASGDSLLDDPLDADADDPNKPEDADHAAEPATDVSADAGADEKPAEPLAESPPPPPDAVDEPATQQPTPPPVDPPPEQTGPQPDGATPCEIAEDELPQAGQ